MNQPTGPDGHSNHREQIDPLAGLARWISEGAVDEAAAERARQHWLAQQAAESTTLAGTLADHAEAGRRVTLTTVGGRRTSGIVTAVGVDFTAVREADLGEVLLPLSRLAMVRSVPGEGEAIGSHGLRYDLVLAHALHEVAADRPAVLVAAGSEAVRGTLQSVGDDVIAVLVNGPERRVAHVSLASVDHIVVLAN